MRRGISTTAKAIVNVVTSDDTGNIAYNNNPRLDNIYTGNVKGYVCFDRVYVSETTVIVMLILVMCS